MSRSIVICLRYKATVSLQAVLEQFKGKQLLVIGDIIFDEYILGDVNRISPEAPVPVLDVTSEVCRFGGAANVAHNIVSLDGNTNIVGVIGADNNGQKLLCMLQGIGINTEGVCIDSSRPTCTKTRVIARTSYTSVSTHQQLIRIDRESSRDVDHNIRHQLLGYCLNRIPQMDAIVFADYDKGVVSTELIQSVVETAKQHRKPIVVDPKIENFWSYKGVTSITPNQKEAGVAVNQQIVDETSLIAVGKEMLDRLEIESLLITRGEQGMSLFRRYAGGQLKVDHVPTQARRVFDVTGAGDTVVAVFSLALAVGTDMLDAARLSNLAGGIVVGEIGCVAVTREALTEAIELENRMQTE